MGFLVDWFDYLTWKLFYTIFKHPKNIQNIARSFLTALLSPLKRLVLILEKSECCTIWLGESQESKWNFYERNIQIRYLSLFYCYLRLLKNSQFKQQKSRSTMSKSIESSSISGSFGSSANARLSAKQAVANGVKCAYKRFQQTRSISFSKTELSRLKELKIMENENLNKFYGICFNQQNELIVLWILCQRGSLEVEIEMKLFNSPGLKMDHKHQQVSIFSTKS